MEHAPGGAGKMGGRQGDLGTVLMSESVVMLKEGIR
jgi:hypothetical protein